MTSKILYLFTRTPLHVGAGSSVGAIDQPVIRERHTGFPVVPGSSLKGSFADQWNDGLLDEASGADGNVKRVRVSKAGGISQAAWLFGSDSDKPAFAGALQFSEARILAFPVRSARGSYAWITCPLMLHRAKRDGVINGEIPSEPADGEAIFKPDGPLALKHGEDGQKLVLEEYCFTNSGGYPQDIADGIAGLLEDELLASLRDRLVILSNGMMSHFVTTACEVAQHVRISDETGTAEGTGLFNQENVPADTLFYAVLGVTASRVPGGEYQGKTADEACDEFARLVNGKKVFQFGGDASTGLGFCTVKFDL